MAQQAGDFDPADFKDRYEEALWTMIEKKKGKPIKTAPAREIEDGNVVDLMAALRKSLLAGGEPRARQTPQPRPKRAANANRRRRKAA